ncbi:hypothetical protein ACRALDRAFT_211326 [Sodiomyces alcalophilus JCM 7366]|uniref:uncharacterized protein n=1 Tax=Sodiomyces alcalophilus JCM 7366 TaxID=591952 RepID=UPI0039B37290
MQVDERNTTQPPDSPSIRSLQYMYLQHPSPPSRVSPREPNGQCRHATKASGTFPNTWSMDAVRNGPASFVDQRSLRLLGSLRSCERSDRHGMVMKRQPDRPGQQKTPSPEPPPP